MRGPAVPGDDLAAAHPALLLVALVAAACAVVTVTIQIIDTDFWHHLVAGRVIWDTRSIPLTQIWSWSSYGQPEMNASPLFRILLWPFWQAGEVNGLYAWRWLTTLAAFGIGWATARRMGARGFTPLVAIAVLVLVYRQRSQVRPETMVAVMMALQIWILETRRLGGADRSWWLVPLALVWANTHLSWYMGLALSGAYLVDEWIPRPGRAAAARVAGLPRLLAVMAACVAVSFLNPFGARGLWQPFEFLLSWRHEFVYRSIGELQPVLWSNNARNGLAALIVAWPLLALWRWRRHGFDAAETMLCIAFTAAMLNTQRLSGAWTIVATPFLARDLDAWVRARRWPAWTRATWTRAGLAAASCVLLSVPEWRRVELPLGVALDWTRYPVGACDFVAAHGLRGRAYNDSYLGGYIAWRFWPDRDRLPFMTGTPEAASKEDRNLAMEANLRVGAWHRLDAKYRFPWALVNRRVDAGAGYLPDFLDADGGWALVFADDAAAVFVRRDGPFAALADSFPYRLAPAGLDRIGPLLQRSVADVRMRRELRLELERMAASSRWNARAHSLLARVALQDGDRPRAVRHTNAAIAAAPLMPGEHERLGIIALAEGRGHEALAEFRRERALRTSGRGIELLIAQAYHSLGRRDEAIRHYRRELALDPSNPDARSGLAALGAAP